MIVEHLGLEPSFEARDRERPERGSHSGDLLGGGTRALLFRGTLNCSVPPNLLDAVVYIIPVYACKLLCHCSLCGARDRSQLRQPCTCQKCRRWHRGVPLTDL